MEKVACWLFGHRFIETISNMYGAAKAIRTCERCSKAQTLLYDVEKSEYVWIDGLFLPVSFEIWIVAMTRTCYQDKAEELKALNPDYVIHWLETSEDLRKMESKYKFPDIRAAADWYEADILPALGKYLFRRIA